MPVVAMPDGTNVQFPDDMPGDAIADLISTKFPDAVTGLSSKAEEPAQDQSEIVTRGDILPLGRTRGGDLVPALPQFIEGPRQTIMDLLDGKRTAKDLSGKEIFELGELFAGAPGGRPSGPPKAPSSPPAPPAPKAPSEGERVAQAGRNIGVELPRAATSDSTSVQQAGKVATNIPIGGVPLKEASQRAIDQLDQAATVAREGFGSGSQATSGQVVREGLTDYIKTKSKAEVDRKYNAVDELIDAKVMVPLASTKELKSKIAAIRENAAMEASPALSKVEKAVDRNGMNYEGIKELRTSIGELLDKGNLLPGDIRTKELKQVYKSLTSDLESSIKAAGGDAALNAWKQANAFNERISAKREALAKLLGANSDEAIFSRLADAAGSTSRANIKLLTLARRSVDKDTWNEFASGVIAKLGHNPAAGGGPDRLGSGVFSPDKFVTNWNKLTPQGKAVLFRSTGNREHARALDDIATVSTRIKQLQQFANPSGTGQFMAGGSIYAGMVVDPVSTVMAVVGSRLVSELLARPATARTMANYSKAVEIAARKPSAQTADLLKRSASALAASIASELGAEESRGRIEAELTGKP